MKKAFSLFLCTVLLLVHLPVSAEGISVSAPEVRETAIPSEAIGWSTLNGYYILSASWQERGEKWEACLTGLPEKLSLSQVRRILSAAMCGERCVLTGTGLIDAEKATNKLPLSFGEKWITDKISEEPMWGDSKHCWAASVSDMMALTGWMGKAHETDTGRGFSGVDDLFGFFNRAFENEGAFHTAALNWVFTGAVSEELAPPRENIEGPMIGKKDAVDFRWIDLRAESCSSVDEYMALLCKRLPLMKKGAALGAVISLNSVDYPLKSDPKEMAGYDSLFSCYVVYQLITVPWSEVRETLFVPDARTGMPVPVTYDPAGERYYETESGAAVDPNGVWFGNLVYDAEQGMWFGIDPNCYEDEESDPFYMRLELHKESEIDLDHPVVTPIITGGEHAVTVMGYVMNTSEKDPARRIRAIFLADSDNDAGIFRPDTRTVRREDRPNTYTMYPAEIVPIGNTKTISLKGYMPHVQTLISCVTALMPPSDQHVRPVPDTGDGSPVFLYAAVLTISFAALVLLCGRRLHKKRSGGTDA